MLGGPREIQKSWVAGFGKGTRGLQAKEHYLQESRGFLSMLPYLVALKFKIGMKMLYGIKAVYVEVYS